MTNLPDIRPAFIFAASARNPIVLGSAGFWFDGTTVFRVDPSGAQTPLAAQPKLNPAAFKPIYFAGLPTAGAIAAPGLNIGDRVLDVENLNDLANGAGSFETTITVAGQLQQTDATDLSKKKFRALVLAQS